MDTVKLTIHPREESGKGPCRRLRAAGLIPAVVYSKGQPSVSISIAAADLKPALAGGSNVVLELHYADSKARKKHYAVVKDTQRLATRPRLLHLDLHEVDLKQEIEAPVAVELLGIPAGVDEGGVLEHSHREVVVRALPTSVPSNLELDVSALGIGDNLRVSDLVAPDGVVILDDPETVLASVHAPRIEEVEAEEEAETFEAAEGEAAEPSAAGSTE
ncbi:MAG TPA: 50S ribosomal protein L25 [Thermoleophilia bacterium]|nr:50S ribosomal protein L25 [Thermoleophilia bacterium]